GHRRQCDRRGSHRSEAEAALHRRLDGRTRQRPAPLRSHAGLRPADSEAQPPARLKLRPSTRPHPRRTVMGTTSNEPVITSYAKAPARTITAGGVTYAYRELGPKTGVPVIFLTHLAAVLDNWDPRVVDGIAAKHRVITFDNRGVGASSGSTPTTIEEMASDAVTFIRALRFAQVDLFGFS